MSIIYSNECGYYISHELLLNEIYENSKQFAIDAKSSLFHIGSPFKIQADNERRYSKICSKAEIKHQTFKTEIAHVKSSFEVFRSHLRNDGLFSNEEGKKPNTEALETADSIYKSTESIPQDLKGGNTESSVVLTQLGNSKYVFPQTCYFYSKNVKEIESHITDKFDLILLDPPWWNKYIRRKRKKSSNAYDMMYNDDLKKIPIEKLLDDDGLVAVWCTNSVQHLDNLQTTIFDKWGIKFVAKWYWVKVTSSGEPVCNFADPPRKQPFEQIIFGCKPVRELPQPPQHRIIVSVPSALHSHKPPLTKVLHDYLPAKPKCLEIFARYLLPGWSSFGLEVLKFQHESLYNISEKNNELL